MAAKIIESTEQGLNLQTGKTKFQAVLANWVCTGPYRGVKLAEHAAQNLSKEKAKKYKKALWTRLQIPHQPQLGNGYHNKFICKQNKKGKLNGCTRAVSRKITHLNLTWCSRTWKQKNLMWSSLEKKILLLEAIWYTFLWRKKNPQILQSDCPFGTRKKQTCCYCYIKAKMSNTWAVNLVEMSNC